jgi:hypothetical protein
MPQSVPIEDVETEDQTSFEPEGRATVEPEVQGASMGDVDELEDELGLAPPGEANLGAKLEEERWSDVEGTMVEQDEPRAIRDGAEDEGEAETGRADTLHDLPDVSSQAMPEPVEVPRRRWKLFRRNVNGGDR